MKKVFSLVLTDVKTIYRDGIFIMAILAPLLFALLIRYLLPVLNEYTLQKFDYNLFIHEPFILSIALIMVPLMLGTLVGFILLEERDEDIFIYFAVTPLMKTGYLVYRLSISIIFTILLSGLVVLICDIHVLSFLEFGLITGMLALETPLFAILLASFATNKVEGLAVSKVMNAIIIIPFVSYFVTSAWKYIGAVLPPYWISLLIVEQTKPIFYLIGYFIHFIFLYIVVKRFIQRMAM